MSAKALHTQEELGLRRGILLVASPNARDPFHQTVVLLLENGRAGSRGVVVNNSDRHGGPLCGDESSHDFEATLLHTCTDLASMPHLPVADGMSLFAEERLSPHESA